MITGPRKHFEQRCRQRGYTIDEVRGCIVSEDGDTVTVDEAHPAYPRSQKPPPKRCRAGAELKRLLGRFGISSTPSCSCNARAAEMDARGCEWCEENIDVIVGWLREEASRRRLPFIDAAARAIVRRAVKNARKAIDN